MQQIKIFLVVILALFGSRCSKQNEHSSKEHMIEMLTSGTWTTESVESDEDGDLTAHYADFAIAFEHRPDATFDGDYYVARGDGAFPELFGQWKVTTDLTGVILANGRIMDVTVSETSLKLIFDDVPSPVKIEGIGRRFTFRLTKK